MQGIKVKGDVIQEQMGNVSRQMEIPIKNRKEMLGIKNTVAEMKLPLMSSQVDWTWLRKDSLSLRISQ